MIRLVPGSDAHLVEKEKKGELIYLFIYVCLKNHLKKPASFSQNTVKLVQCHLKCYYQFKVQPS